MTGTRAAEPGAPSATRRTDAALLGLVVGLAVYNVVRSTVIDGDVDIATNIAVGGVVLAVGRRAGLSWGELGGDPQRLLPGLRLGLAAAAIVTAVVTVGVALFAGSAGFDDAEVDISLPAMLLRVLVVIPIATAVVEEVIFRGVLHGLLRRRFVIRRATACGAVLFGLWHVFPAWLGDGGAGAADLGRWAAVAGTFAATSVAGLAFTWLRERSGHLVAPVLGHTATNSVTFAAAWIAAR